jgi:CheY-like chemotaxis protein
MRKILIVDDSADNVALVKYFLGDEYDCLVATSGIEALVLVQDIQFDLVLSDYQMENGDGIWLLGQLKLMPKAPPCIILTADLIKEESFFKDAGAQGFCTKHQIEDNLIREVRRVLDKSL